MTTEVAKLIIEFAKQGERDPERLCDLTLKQLSKQAASNRCVGHHTVQIKKAQVRRAGAPSREEPHACSDGEVHLRAGSCYHSGTRGGKMRHNNRRGRTLHAQVARRFREAEEEIGEGDARDERQGLYGRS
jgi:hypothetical protein